MLKQYKFTIKEVHEATQKAIIAGDRTMKVGDITVKVSDRYITFLQHGVTCPCCGLKATHYVTTVNEGATAEFPYHLNLMREGFMGDVLYTKDHILPRKLGGKDVLDNYQPMCAKCNATKGHNFTKEDVKVLKERGLTVEDVSTKERLLRDNTEFNAQSDYFIDYAAQGVQVGGTYGQKQV